jgi:hypothetical protein
MPDPFPGTQNKKSLTETDIRTKFLTAAAELTAA